jgi:hypothetical protein
MVKVYYKGRHVGDEPPYTEEEELELYRMASYQGGGATILHGPRAAMPPRPPEVPPPPAKKSRRS